MKYKENICCLKSVIRERRCNLHIVGNYVLLDGVGQQPQNILDASRFQFDFAGAARSVSTKFELGRLASRDCPMLVVAVLNPGRTGCGVSVLFAFFIGGGGLLQAPHSLSGRTLVARTLGTSLVLVWDLCSLAAPGSLTGWTLDRGPGLDGWPRRVVQKLACCVRITSFQGVECNERLTANFAKFETLTDVAFPGHLICLFVCENLLLGISIVALSCKAESE